MARLVEEADKCALLCANCHRQVHANNEEKYFGKDTNSRHRDGRSDSDQGSLFSNSELPVADRYDCLRGSPKLSTAEGRTSEAGDSGQNSMAQRDGLRLSNTDEDFS